MMRDGLACVGVFAIALVAATSPAGAQKGGSGEGPAPVGLGGPPGGPFRANAAPPPSRTAPKGALRQRVLYPIGAVYPVYYSSYPWPELARAEPGLADVTREEGDLELSVWPQDAAVSLDGQAFGSLFEGSQQIPVRRGFHRIEVDRAGYRSAIFDLEVAVGFVYPIRATLIAAAAGASAESVKEPAIAPEQGSGTLRLTVGQAGGRIFVDGEPWGDARAGVPGFLVLRAGEHRVVVELPSRRPLMTRVQIRDQTTTRLMLPVAR